RYLPGRRSASVGGFLPDGHDRGAYLLAGYRFSSAWNAMPFAVVEHYRPLEPIVFKGANSMSGGVNFRPMPAVVLKLMATKAATYGAGGYGEIGNVYYLTSQASWVF
ncbi:MAG: hypothetical protein WKG01_21135, partial [Kofleriaceae bacterium]